MSLEDCPTCHDVQNSERPHRLEDHGRCRICEHLVHTDDRGRILHHMRRKCMGSITCSGSGELERRTQ